MSSRPGARGRSLRPPPDAPCSRNRSCRSCFVKLASGSRGLTWPSSKGGGFTAAGDDRRVDQRAALDDQAARVELAVDLGQQLLLDRPSLSIVWRNRQIEEWSGVSSSSGMPQKRRNDSRSRTASSAAGSESEYHCCRRTILNIVERRIGRRALRKTNAAAAGSRRKPTNRRSWSISSKKPAGPRIGLDESVSERRLVEATARHRRFASPESRRESRAQGFCKGLLRLFASEDAHDFDGVTDRVGVGRFSPLGPLGTIALRLLAASHWPQLPPRPSLHR